MGVLSRAARRAGAARAAQLVWYDTPPRQQGRRRTDALGLHHLEDRVADWFWPGFSRRTTCAGYYVIVPYGLLMVEQALEKYGLPRDDDTRRFLFGRFERLWVVSQLVASAGSLEPDPRVFGAEATAPVLEENSRAIPLDFLHLAQGEVGALGVYLPSLRAHRLVAPRQLRLAPLGWELGQWMWEGPPEDRAAYHEFVLKTLNPRNQTIPQRVGRVTLKAFGEQASLSRLAGREDLRNLLWRRLFEERPPPQSLGVLRPMSEQLVELHRAGVSEARDVLVAITERRQQSGAIDLRFAAQVALAVSDLGRAMLRIFDRMYQSTMEAGYSTAWSDCVQSAITEDLVDALNAHMGRYRSLNCNERIENLSAGCRVFGQTMRRFNTQNPYSTFESILNLHTMSQRALGAGEGFLGRAGETVYLRQASTEQASLDAESWQPTFRMAAMQELLGELGRLS